MTIKEFVSKYNVPYSVVWQATCNVKPVSTLMRDRDYPEKELYKAVAGMLVERIERHKKALIEQRTYLNNMRCKDEVPKV